MTHKATLRASGRSQSLCFEGQPGGALAVRVAGQPGQRGTSGSTLVTGTCQAVLALGHVKMFYLLIFVAWREP